MPAAPVAPCCTSSASFGRLPFTVETGQIGQIGMSQAPGWVGPVAPTRAAVDGRSAPEACKRQSWSSDHRRAARKVDRSQQTLHGRAAPAAAARCPMLLFDADIEHPVSGCVLAKMSTPGARLPFAAVMATACCCRATSPSSVQRLGEALGARPAWSGFWTWTTVPVRGNRSCRRLILVGVFSAGA